MPVISDLFHVAYGNKFDMNKMESASKEVGIAFVGRKGGLTGVSGVAGYVAPLSGVKPYEAGLLTVALGGSRLLSSYVQQRPFYTAQNVAVLTPVDGDMTLRDRLFYAMCIRHNAFRYTAFGREANRTLGTIAVPDAIPAWVSTTPMPTHDGLARAAGESKALTDPTGSHWASFRLGDLFRITRGKYIPKLDQVPGSTPVVTSSAKNNGISKFLDVSPLFQGGQITVTRNGSVCEAFYQQRAFFASDDVFVLDPIQPLSRFASLFVARVVRLEKHRYNYGRKLRIPLLEDAKVRLPVTKTGLPDYGYMEAYMKGLPFSAAIESV